MITKKAAKELKRAEEETEAAAEKRRRKAAAAEKRQKAAAEKKRRKAAAAERQPVVQMMISLVTLLYHLAIFDYQLTMVMVKKGMRTRANYRWLVLLLCVGLLLNTIKFIVCAWLVWEFLKLVMQRRTIG